MRNIHDTYKLIDEWVEKHMRVGENIMIYPKGDGKNFSIEYLNDDKRHISYISYDVVDVLSDQTLLNVMEDFLEFFRERVNHNI